MATMRSFRLRIYPRSGQIDDTGDRRREFWRFVENFDLQAIAAAPSPAPAVPYYEESSTSTAAPIPAPPQTAPPQTDVEAYERRVEASFGRELKQQLRRYLTENFATEREVTRTLRRVYFRTRIRGYSSLQLAVAVKGMKSLAKAFDDDFDLLKMFLQTYTPIAFSDSVGVSGMRNEVEAEAQIPKTFQEEFQGEDKTPSKSSRISSGIGALVGMSSDRATWLWVISNLSLVVPVLLSLAVLYVAFDGLNQERETLRKAATDLSSKSDEVIKEQRARSASFDKLEQALITKTLENLNEKAVNKSPTPAAGASKSNP
jgi:hypothetical protein